MPVTKETVIYMKWPLIVFIVLFLCFHTNAQRPNILWVTIEDTSPHFIGCYDNKNARTPVIDRLARDGVRFTNAFSTGTVCAPSRCTIITGVRTYTMGTGNHRSTFPIPDFIKGFPYYMQQAGYYVTNNNKTDYNIAHEKEFIVEAWNERSPKAGWWGRKPGQPFFAVVNFEDSHQSRTMTHPYKWYEEHVLAQLPAADRITENGFDLPPFYRDSPEMRRQFARVYNSIKLTDNRLGALLNRLKEDRLMDSTIIFFYGDHGEGIPRAKTNGINLGYRVPFVIWFPPVYQHLSPWGTSAVSDELISFEDLAPTLISLTGQRVPDHMKGRILFGRNRTPPVNKLFLSTDRSDNGIDMVRSVTNGRYFYSRNFMPYTPELRYVRYMEISDIKKIMRADLAANRLNTLQKSLFAPRPAEFLYDISRDEWQIRNLATDPHHLSLLNEMRSDLKDNMVRSMDVMLLPEYEIDLISRKTTAYEFRLDEVKFPVEQIYAAASVSGIRGEKMALQQLELLKHSNDIVRYWAVTGLRSQDRNVLKPYKVQLRKAMQDTYPPVIIIASAIYYDLFGDKIAEDNLKKYALSENMQLALLALHLLLYVDEPEPFIETVRKVYDKKDIAYDVSAASKDFLGKLGHIRSDWENR